MGWGDIDNTSRVELDGSPSARARVVYGVRRVPEQRIQVGYVKVDYSAVVVWRPYHPDDDRWDAKWASGRWRNAYVIRMPRDQETDDPRRPTYGMVDVERDDLVVQLPRVELDIHHDLKEHLRAVATNIGARDQRRAPAD